MFDLTEDLVRGVLSHLDYDRRGRTALLACCLSSRSLFNLSAPILWRRTAIDVETANVWDSVEREHDCGAPLLKWLDLMNGIPIAEVPLSSSSAAAVLRSELYIRSVRSLILAFDPGSRGRRITVADLGRWLQVETVSLESGVGDSVWGREWTSWVGAQKGNDRPRSVIAIRVKVTEAAFGLLKIKRVRDLTLVLPIAEVARRLYIKDVLANLGHGVRTLSVRARSPAEADFRAIHEYATKYPGLQSVTWDLDSLRTRTATAFDIDWHRGVLNSADDGSGVSAGMIAMGILLGSGTKLRDLTLSSSVIAKDLSVFVDRLINLAKLDITMPAIVDTVTTDCVLAQLVNMTHLIIRYEGVKLFSLAAAIPAMPRLINLKLEALDKGAVGFRLPLLAVHIQRLRALELRRGVLAVAADDLGSTGFPELESMRLIKVEVTKPGMFEYHKEMKDVLSDRTRAPRLAVCVWEDHRGMRVMNVNEARLIAKLKGFELQPGFACMRDGDDNWVYTDMSRRW
ncbi:hypothetical protein HK101_012059 [Irineochytrium annulatum]|nr:hypothetical protein HK101_012059 [Irineochytrium annulatum]